MHHPVIIGACKHKANIHHKKKEKRNYKLKTYHWESDISARRDSYITQEEQEEDDGDTNICCRIHFYICLVFLSNLNIITYYQT